MDIYLTLSISLSPNSHLDCLQQYVCGRAFDLLNFTKITASHLVPKAQVNKITLL